MQVCIKLIPWCNKVQSKCLSESDRLLSYPIHCFCLVRKLSITKQLQQVENISFNFIYFIAQYIHMPLKRIYQCIFLTIHICVPASLCSKII